jgi:spermidine synthase
VRLGKKYFGLKDIPNTTYFVADAKKFAKRSGQKKKYDCVIIDLYIGNSVPDFVGSKGFFKDVKGLLRSDGSIMFNFFIYSNQPEVKQNILTMLTSLFPYVDMKSNHRNIFFYCRA